MSKSNSSHTSNSPNNAVEIKDERDKSQIDQDQYDNSSTQPPTISHTSSSSPNSLTFEKQRLEQKKLLLSQLSKQLLYYFSNTNLSKDTYLKTIMGLNSGYVPTIILANFQNVTRIVSGFDPDFIPEDDENDTPKQNETQTNETSLTTADNDNDDDESNTPSPSTNYIQKKKKVVNVPALLSQAALETDSLEVVVLDQKGMLVRKITSNKNSTNNTTKSENLEQNDSNHDSSSKTDSDTVPSNGDIVHKITLVAIGPRVSPSAGKKAERILPSTNDSKITRRQVASTSNTESINSNPTASAGKVLSSSSTIIILRDVPEETTEADVKGAFETEDNGGPIISKIHKDIGNCWFVTLDKSTTQETIMSTMLDLRNKKINGDSVKARLKTQSVASRSYSPPSISQDDPQKDATATSSAPSQNSYYNPYRNNGGNTGRRSSATGPYRSQGQKEKDGEIGDGQVYAGDRPYYSSSRKPSFNGSRGSYAGGSGSNFSKSRVGGRPGNNVGNSNSINGTQKGTSIGNKDRVPRIPAIPPPPLVDEHFPTLSGSDGELASVVTKEAPATEGENGNMTNASESKHEEVSGDVASTVENVSKEKNDVVSTPEPQTNTASSSSNEKATQHIASNPQPSSKGKSVTTGGYAAALLKAAPAPKPTPKETGKGKKSKSGSGDSSSKTKGGNNSSNVSASTKKAMRKKDGITTNHESMKSNNTATTDDSSADDKSSLSSKPESDKGILIGGGVGNLSGGPSAQVVVQSAPIWGGGKSFADIVKKEGDHKQISTATVTSAK
mmetsp:Transcript_4303/g.6005  ORF Transcript_4303/g.6005 Transcript_4303/m.6005 type:complete len:785 (+) Transcript_4303:811-3165(+)|eukprot:CAMPEP_0184863686 /NCGR_PEP_ID=MMETSP0580-20130426/12154_1 /TAXON_ID=1118495 /ORGANISM="Dactyliosolen fragilissimus" /LENGTH=784 /DNA_ID=CAMNT_0027362155 /DNA_START=723 /DNA_END=3077 /DNA_ORIENTATION=+